MSEKIKILFDSKGAYFLKGKRKFRIKQTNGPKATGNISKVNIRNVLSDPRFKEQVRTLYTSPVYNPLALSTQTVPAPPQPIQMMLPFPFPNSGKKDSDVKKQPNDSYERKLPDLSEYDSKLNKLEVMLDVNKDEQDVNMKLLRDRLRENDVAISDMLKTYGDRLNDLQALIDALMNKGSGKDLSKITNGSAATNNLQLEKLMESVKHKKTFIGVYGTDQFTPEVLKKVKKHGSMILNIGYHWCAIYWISTPKTQSPSIEYYDPFGDDPTSAAKSVLRQIQAKISPKKKIQIKINKIQHQKVDTNNCGYFAVHFLMKRYDGRTFKEATDYDQHIQGEKDVEAFKKRLGIKNFEHKIDDEVVEGGNILSRIGKAIHDRVSIRKDDFPPSVRRLIHKYQDHRIEKVTVFRKPLGSMIIKIGDWLTNGKLSENRKRLNYNDIFHVGTILQLTGGLIYRLEKNEVISMSQYKPDPKEETFLAGVSQGGFMTLKEMLLKTQEIFEKQGINMFLYQVAPIGEKPTNNCQVFAANILRSMGLYSREVEKWLMQDAGKLIQGIPGIAEKATAVTNFASRLNTFIHGKGKIHLGRMKDFVMPRTTYTFEEQVEPGKAPREPPLIRGVKSFVPNA